MKENTNNKKLLRKYSIIYIIITLIISIALNLILCDKLIHQAYNYKNNVLELNLPLLDIITKSEIDSIVNSLDNDTNGKYTGERVNGKKEGNGTFVWEDGSVYTGEFNDDTINGTGKLTIPGKGTYEGNFVNGKRSGEGTYHFINGDIYTGSWHNDIMSGYGTYTFSNGDKYVGQFSNNKFNGNGTYTKGSNKYTGNWVNNEYQK